MKMKIARATLLAFAAFVGSPSWAEQNTAEASLIVFENVRVLPMTDDLTIDNARVTVQGHEIVSVEAMADGASPADAVVIDGSGKTITPGLADMHVHYSPDSGPLYIANGITAVRNLWGNNDSAAWDADARSGAIMAPHHYYSGPLMDGPEPIWGSGAISIASAGEAVGAIEAQRSAGFKAVKLYELLTPEIYRVAVAAAKEKEMQVWTHVPQGLTYTDVIDLEVDSIEHLNNVQDLLLPDGVEIEAGRMGYLESWSEAIPAKMKVLAEQTAARGVWNAPTYCVNMQSEFYGADPEAFYARPEIKYLGPGLLGWWRSIASEDNPAREALARTASPKMLMMIKALYDAGAPLLIGTDSPNPFTIPAFAIHDELQAFIEAGIPVEAVLRIATADAARFFGEEGQWGVVAAGARADLVLLDADPTKDLSTYKRPVGVMVNGHWYDRTAIDEGLEAVRKDVERQEAEAAEQEAG